MHLPIETDIPESFFEAEEREGYLVTAEMKTLWALEIDLLKQIEKICERHGIRWYASSGTVLGAVRHGGFIPWDDDIDLEMQREDYDRFAEIAREELKEPYFLQDYRTDPTACHCHIQVRNSATTAILKGDLEKKFPFNQGVFVDIFPIDRISESEKETEKMGKILLILKGRMYRLRDFYYGMGPGRSEGLAARIGRAMLRPVIKPILRLMQGAYRKVSMKYYRSGSTKILNTSLPPLKTKRKLYEETYGDGVEIDFEYFKIKVPRDYEKYLGELYGDWRTPVRGGAYHSGMVFDAEKPYTEYIR
ncbi:MAG: LicD family protein [Bacteroidales bacterium]|nr:LicD family protein [Bacteroidales bacterium]